MRDGSNDPAVKRPPDREQRAHERVALVRDEPLTDLAAAPVGHHHADDHRHRQAEAEDRLSHEMRDPVERAPEHVAERAEERGPEAGADDAVRDEAPVREPRRAGDERRERPDQADEAPDQDRLASVALEVGLHLLEPRLGDLEARAVFLEETASKPLADEEAGGVAEYGGQPDDPDQGEQVDRALPGHYSGGYDDRLAGRHETDECAGLEEGRHCDQRVGPCPERPRRRPLSPSSGRAASRARRSRRRRARAQWRSTKLGARGSACASATPRMPPREGRPPRRSSPGRT